MRENDLVLYLQHLSRYAVMDVASCEIFRGRKHMLWVSMSGTVGTEDLWEYLLSMESVGGQAFLRNWKGIPAKLSSKSFFLSNGVVRSGEPWSREWSNTDGPDIGSCSRRFDPTT
jgi:hypothetical protein